MSRVTAKGCVQPPPARLNNTNRSIARVEARFQRSRVFREMEKAPTLENLSPEQLDRLLRQMKRGKGAPPAGPSRDGDLRKQPYEPDKHGNFEVRLEKPGIIESLTFASCRRVPPGPGQIEIEVYAAGLNFRDVMIALGMYPSIAGMKPLMGSDVSGKVVAVGPNVTEFRVGDEVFGMVAGGFKHFVTAPVDSVTHKPDVLTFETAASLPVVFTTCIYGLEYLARLSKGERVLIHSAAGGVGLAAIQIAQETGAEIFATVGTPEKRALMKTLGIQHVMDSRSLGFADDVRKLTDGDGVDVILNSLYGEAIPKGLEILRPAGRFIELGKRDLMENKQIGLLPFAKGISFSAVELGAVARTRPGLLKTVLADIAERFQNERLKPLPARFFSMADAVKAFSSMTRGTHIGKFVFLVKGETIMIGSPEY